MKRGLLLLILFTIFIEFSYAAFPIVEDIQIQVVESTLLTNHDSLKIFGLMALILAATGGLLVLLQGVLAPNAFFGVYASIGMICWVIAFISFIIWTFNKKWARWFWPIFIALGLIDLDELINP